MTSPRDPKAYTPAALAKGLRTDSIVDLVCCMGEMDIPNSSDNPLLAAMLNEMLERAKTTDVRKDAAPMYWVERFSTWWSMEPYDEFLASRK